MSRYVPTPPPLRQPDVWRDGKLLVFNKHAELPMRCVKTNDSTDYTLTCKLTWHEPVIYLAILAGVLIYFILAITLRKTAVVHVPLSPTARARRTRVILTACGLALAGVGLTLVAAMRHETLGWLLVPGLLLPFIGLIYGMIAAPPVKPKKIDDHRVYLSGVCEQYLAMLPDRRI